MDPPPRLCLLENVPGLKDLDEKTGRSNYDAVQAALEGIGYAFVSTEFDASETGIPNRRPRLYMVAIAGMTAATAGLRLRNRVQASMDSMLKRVTHRPLSDFLLERFVPEATITDWMPELCKKRPARSLRKELPQMAACPHASDESRYVSCTLARQHLVRVDEQARAAHVAVVSVSSRIPRAFGGCRVVAPQCQIHAGFYKRRHADPGPEWDLLVVEPQPVADRCRGSHAAGGRLGCHPRLRSGLRTLTLLARPRWQRLLHLRTYQFFLMFVACLPEVP